MGRKRLVKSKAQKTMKNVKEQNSFPGKNFSFKEGSTQSKNYI